MGEIIAIHKIFTSFSQVFILWRSVLGIEHFIERFFPITFLNQWKLCTSPIPGAAKCVNRVNFC